MTHDKLELAGKALRSALLNRNSAHGLPLADRAALAGVEGSFTVVPLPTTARPAQDQPMHPPAQEAVPAPPTRQTAV